MKKLIFVMVVSFCVTGCGAFDRAKSKVTGKPTEVCVDGVTYLQFTSGVAVKVDLSGKPVACK